MPTTRLTQPPTPPQRQPRRTPAEAAARASLRRDLGHSFDNHLLKSGMHHPAEQIIEEALSTHKDLAHQWLAEFCFDEDNSLFAANILFCLGRKPAVGTPEWRLALVNNGLKSDDIEKRDAATNAAFSWADNDIMEALKAYVPTETQKWLKDSVQESIDCLQAKSLLMG